MGLLYFFTVRYSKYSTVLKWPNLYTVPLDDGFKESPKRVRQKYKKGKAFSLQAYGAQRVL
jgi:hypothetical protein